MSSSGPPLLSREDKMEIFHLATRSLVHRYGDRFKSGMSDKELIAALEHSLGIFGGTGGQDRLCVSFKGSGLRIWGDWHTVNHIKEAPLFSGKVTVARAREFYAISDPENKQINLL